jgi:hypothetical protein
LCNKSLHRSEEPSTCPCSESDQQSIPPHLLSPQSNLILSTNLCLGLHSDLFPSGSNPPITCMWPSLPFMLYAMPISSSLTQYSNCTWQRVQVVKLLIMQLSPASCHFDPNIVHRTLFPNIFSLCCALNVRGDQVSHPYRTTGKIIVFYIQIFSLVDSR